MFKVLLEAASSLVFPVECEICASHVEPPAARGVCRKCAGDIRLIEPPHCAACGRTLKSPLHPHCGECDGEGYFFDRAYACTLYHGAMKELLHAYKFGNQKILKSFFVEIMMKFVRENLKPGDFDSIVAVPLDPNRRAERGFNQSEILSRSLAQGLEKPEQSSMLGRKKSPFTQSLLNKSERLANVKNCFFAKKQLAFAGKKILLVDDILTTGQTASECAHALKDAGAGSVTVLALARGI